MKQDRCNIRFIYYIKILGFVVIVREPRYVVLVPFMSPNKQKEDSGDKNDSYIMGLTKGVVTIPSASVHIIKH